MIPDNTQDIEGINGIVKRVLKMSPSLDLELLNARVLGKKTQGPLATSGRNKLLIEVETSKCLAHHEGALLALGCLLCY